MFWSSQNPKYCKSSVLSYTAVKASLYKDESSYVGLCTSSTKYVGMCTTWKWRNSNTSSVFNGAGKPRQNYEKADCNQVSEQREQASRIRIYFPKLGSNCACQASCGTKTWSIIKQITIDRSILNQANFNRLLDTQSSKCWLIIWYARKRSIFNQYLIHYQAYFNQLFSK